MIGFAGIYGTRCDFPKGMPVFGVPSVGIMHGLSHSLSLDIHHLATYRSRDVLFLNLGGIKLLRRSSNGNHLG